MAYPLLPFLDTNSLLMSSLGWKALCNVIFLVLRSICLSSYLVHSNNDSEYLTRIYGCLSLSWVFCGRVWFRKAFSFFWGTLFLVCPSSLLVWWCPLPIFPSTCNFLYLQVIWRFPDMVVLFLLLFLFSHFSLSAWHIYQCLIPSLYTSCIFLLLVSGFPVIFHFLQIPLYHPCT